MTPDPLLVLVHHGDKGKQVLLGTLPGVPWCHPGGPTPPQILNVVVEMIVHLWFGLLTKKEARPDGFRYTVMDKVDLLSQMMA